MLRSLEGSDASVQGTNDDAQVSKLSCAKAGYFRDEFIQYFVRRASRRSPLINRGYYSRHAALRQLLESFLAAAEAAGQQPQVLVLGAGYDTTWFQMRKDRGRLPYKCLEVDFKEVTQRKAAIIAREPALHGLLLPGRRGEGEEEEQEGQQQQQQQHGSAATPAAATTAAGQPSSASPSHNMPPPPPPAAAAPAAAFRSSQQPQPGSRAGPGPQPSSSCPAGPAAAAAAALQSAAPGSGSGAAGVAPSSSSSCTEEAVAGAPGAAAPRQEGVGQPAAGSSSSSGGGVGGGVGGGGGGGILVDPHGGQVLSGGYCLLPVDLREEGALAGAAGRAGLDWSAPTLVLSECVLVYMEPGHSDMVVRWAAGAFPNAVMAIYEQIRPDDAFGRQMISNLELRGCPLRGLHATPTLQSHCQRLLRNGWGWADARDMDELYRRFLAAGERARVERLELFDELEEWHMIQEHYCIALGRNNRDGWLAGVGFDTPPAAAATTLEAPSSVPGAVTRGSLPLHAGAERRLPIVD
ncbi:hypothetical protein Agub_g2458 [Astrephomene gubernaculifera]|uniref:[phosphatase 2A protein]-leucine-carboxy methyltransferase n=1 Tax=Astrephomene gubernaculifera TaxID=47775 RepID=A0AAD3DJ81_9CHLO|nr:hypothetical protein Agub_g2458 [Astrephomene gubernaculifera]